MGDRQDFIRSCTAKKPFTSDLKGITGMSEPFPFQFNIIEQHGVAAGLLVHAIVFTSYATTDNEKEMQFCTPDVDPRAAAFFKYVMKNQQEELAAMIDKQKKEVAELERQLAKLRKEINDV